MSDILEYVIRRLSCLPNLLSALNSYTHDKEGSCWSVLVIDVNSPDFVIMTGDVTSDWFNGVRRPIRKMQVSGTHGYCLKRPFLI